MVEFLTAAPTSRLICKVPTAFEPYQFIQEVGYTLRPLFEWVQLGIID